MADPTYQPKTYRRRGGDEFHVASGGILEVETGGKLQFNGVDQAAILAAAVANPVAAPAAGYKVARGISAVTGTLDVDTGLATVTGVSAVLYEDPVLAQAMWVTAAAGAAGHVVLKTWKPTAAADATPVAGSAAKNVAWVAVGT